MIQASMLPNLDGIASQVNFRCSNDEIAELSEKLNLSENTVRNATRFQGGTLTVARVVNELLSSNHLITLI